MLCLQRVCALANFALSLAPIAFISSIYLHGYLQTISNFVDLLTFLFELTLCITTGGGPSGGTSGPPGPTR